MNGIRQRFSIISWCSCLLVLLLSGCSLGKPKPSELVPKPPVQETRKIAIFFDGTANDDQTGTNVAELFELVKKTNRDGSRVYAFYVEGVGAKGKPLGMATAWGLGHRVKAAYRFVLQHHRAGDEIYLFGFSRGAFSARVLASMLHNVGLPDQPPDTVGQSELAELVDEIFDAFKCSGWATNEMCKNYDRAGNIRKALLQVGLKTSPVRVRFMGLWDTVEALGWPTYEEIVDVPNSRYGDQFCNIDRVAHALALDDNRSRIFTPLLMTRIHLVSGCQEVDLTAAVQNKGQGTKSNPRIDEVYFAGAHADVGGGYEDAEGQLSGVSMNWMVRHAIDAGLPLDASRTLPLKEQPMACAHDPEGEFPFKLVYRRQYRAIDTYANSPESASDTIKFHGCLIAHIEARPRGIAEYGGKDAPAQELLRAAGSTGRFVNCFVAGADGKLTFTPGPPRCLIEKVGDCPQAKLVSVPVCDE